MLQSSDQSVTITLDLFTVSLLLACLLFGFALVLTKRKYAFLQRAYPPFDLKKLLVLSAGTACFLRIMSFVGVIAMDIANVRAHYSLNPANPEGSGGGQQQQQQQPIDRDQNFYDASMTVLFDLPNTIIISSYLLLTLVWAECSLLSRFHTQSSQQWRKRWLVLYMVFNSALYATQVILYILIFVGGGMSKSVEIYRDVVNVAMAGINLSAVFLVFLLYLYLSVSFSGFPFRSQSSKESLQKISHVMAFWSVSRIVWGVAMLVLYISDVDLLRPEGKDWHAIILFLLLVFCEIAPIIVLMDYSFTTIYEFADSATREMSSLATGRHVLMSEGGDDRGPHGSDQGRAEEELPIIREDEASCDSAEPLLGRSVS
mmetsp:Transcript_16683/g.31430  ORF Transcript_16683/g.31430 Transcript_16683/m.31430 type:complete len:372 (+) Transcript_16683:2530-3645(+)